MRESTTTDGGQSETIGSSTSGRGVSALSGVSSMGQDAPSAMAGIHTDASLHPSSGAGQALRASASFDDMERYAPCMQ